MFAPLLWPPRGAFVCPAFLPNPVRKLTALLGRLARRAEALINEAVDDPGGQAALRAYVAAMREAP